MSTVGYATSNVATTNRFYQ